MSLDLSLLPSIVRSSTGSVFCLVASDEGLFAFFLCVCVSS